MRTDQLIAALTADAAPRAGTARRLLRGALPALAVTGAAFLAVWGTRPDLAAALASPALVKTLLPAVLSLAAAALALQMPRPDARPRGRALLAPLAAVALAGFGLALGQGGWSGLVAALMVPSLPVCLLSVPALSVPFLALALWSMEAGAPLRPGRAGAVAGLAAGAAATAVYSLFCTQDGPLFFYPTYATAILSVALAGAVIGRRRLRW
jgi:hypothetical protein